MVHMTEPVARPPILFWHRELPPLEADVVAEHTLECQSDRVPGTIAHRDELWSVCHESLMARARLRLEQEVARLGGDYAHVLDEEIDSRHDPAADTAWLHGVFTYVLLKKREQPDR
jgi:hypothetical protein